MLAGDNLPATLAKFPHFRRLFGYINASANSMLPDSLTIIREDFRWSVAVRRSVIRDALVAAKSKIHLTCDAWTSLNGYTIWGVQVIFLDLKYRKQDLLIGLERLRGDHRSETQAGVTLQVADEYGIAKSLGYVVMDNASLNNTLARTMELILGE